MKRLLLMAAFAMIAVFSNAQDLPNFAAIPVDKRSDFDSTANDAALKAANYLISTPIEKDNVNRLVSAAFLIKWMTNSPDYTFNLEAEGGKACKKDTDLLSVYIAALTKSALDNKEIANDAKKMKLESFKLFIAYCKNPVNNVKVNSDLKKMIQASDNGELEKYLKI